MKRITIMISLCAMFICLFASAASASTISGSAVAKGSPCFHLQFRDSTCSGYVKDGSPLVLLTGGDAWYRHVNYNGRNGYVSSNYMKVIKEPAASTPPPVTPAPTTPPPVTPSPTTPPPSSAQLKADHIIAYAESLIGKVHYKFGANDTQHFIFDCSSFTKFVFAQDGISLKWGARLQSYQGTPISQKANLHKGDLVHFSIGTPGVISHVGIYIGGGKFIHNTTGSVYGLAISDINSGWYANRFIVGTRVIPGA